MTEVLFDFYEILVENIFGSVGLAIMGIALVIILLLFILRTSAIFILQWMIFYFIVMGTLYIGALGLVLGGFIAISYTLIAIIRFIFRPD
jgi:hypothetical protein